MSAGAMAVLARAIRERRVVAFLYNGRERTVEPQCLGTGTRGTLLLRGHQLEGGDAGEPLFDVAKMRGLELLERTFERPGPNYQRDDSAMAAIVEQL
jgi:predicted DNA-binding transcriptional regulator YafY